MTKSILPFQYGDIGKLVHSLAGVLDISALVDNALLFEVPTPSSERGNLDYDKIVGILFVNHRVLGKAPQILDRMNVGLFMALFMVVFPMVAMELLGIK